MEIHKTYKQLVILILDEKNKMKTPLAKPLVLDMEYLIKYEHATTLEFDLYNPLWKVDPVKTRECLLDELIDKTHKLWLLRTQEYNDRLNDTAKFEIAAKESIMNELCGRSRRARESGYATCQTRNYPKKGGE